MADCMARSLMGWQIIDHVTHPSIAFVGLHNGRAAGRWMWWNNGAGFRQGSMNIHSSVLIKQSSLEPNPECFIYCSKSTMLQKGGWILYQTVSIYCLWKCPFNNGYRFNSSVKLQWRDYSNFETKFVLYFFWRRMEEHHVLFVNSHVCSLAFF